MLYTFEPLDFALYRDGKPFNAEEFSRAHPLGLVPMPRTVYGALRSLILYHNEVSLNAFAAGIDDLNGLRSVLGTPDKTGALQMRGPYLARESSDLELLLPCPADAVGIIRTNGSTDAGLQRPVQNGSSKSNLSDLLPLAPHKSEEGEWVHCIPTDGLGYDPGRWLLEGSELKNYLLSRSFRLASVDDSCKTEPHVGIARDAGTRQAITGNLYTVEFIRAAADVSTWWMSSRGADAFPRKLCSRWEGSAARSRSGALKSRRISTTPTPK